MSGRMQWGRFLPRFLRHAKAIIAAEERSASIWRECVQQSLPVGCFAREWRTAQGVACFRFDGLNSEWRVQQSMGIFTSAWKAADEGSSSHSNEPVRSPLSQVPGPVVGASRSVVSGQKTALAVLSKIRQGPQKINLVAEMVRGMRVEDALQQMAVSTKRAAKTVAKAIQSAQANAVHNHGLDKDRLVVSEAFVGKDRYLKRIFPHGKGKAGKLVHPKSKLTVVLKEMSEVEETELARARILRQKGSHISRRQTRWVPHKLLATQWNRRRKTAVTVA